jgi:hypothetical protein
VVPDVGLALTEYAAKRVAGVTTMNHFMTLTEAFAFGPLAPDDLIEARELLFDEGAGLNFTRALSVTLRGGFNTCYMSNSGVYSTITPSLTISRGLLTVENIIIQ